MGEREKWLEDRRKGLGGSDVAPIMGLSPWKTAYDTWKDKMGMSELDHPDTKAQAYGKMMEGTLRNWYCETTGREVVVPEMATSPDHPFMLATLDGLTGDRRILEIKTSRSGKDWGEPGSNVVPVYYNLQVQHYMLVYAIPVADIVVSIAGSMPEIYEVPADVELQKRIVSAEEEFWELVQEGRPPEPVTFEDALARYGGGSVAGITVANDAVVEACDWLRTYKKIKAELETEEKKKKAVVMNYLGDLDTVTTTLGVTLATWKASRPSEVFDKELFAEDHPDLYAQYLLSRPGSRRLLIKG
jgi:putative phage-type endonuclease